MNRSYRKEILDVLKQQGKYTDINKIDFNWLADKVGIKVAKVEAEFIDIDDVFYHASIEYWGDHQKKSQKILQLKGENALATLIRHDLSNVYLYLRDTPSSEIELPRNKTVLFVKDYIEKGMSKNYFDLLRLNPELRPDKNLDIRLYAHFIVHSLFFDAEKIKSLSQEEFKAQSRRLIIALFKPKTTMDSKMSLKKKILEATLQLIRSEDNTDLSIQHLSDYSGISISNIESNYETLDQIINMIFEIGTSEHLAKSKVIIEKPDPLQNLLNHDLELVYRIKFFAKKYHSSSVTGAIGRKSIQDIQVKMYQHYEQILNTKVYLMPEDVQDSVLYAKFITHSLFFLTKENLEQILHADLTKESATRQIIESLFPKIDLGF